MLRSIELIHEHNPHEIIISTPGPIGLLGVLAARLLGVKCKGIYHTDFKIQMDYLAGEGLTPMVVESYSRWFYSLMDEIRVPTVEYQKILTDRGYENHKMALFKRGIDAELFSYDQRSAERLRAASALPAGFNLLWAGRVSQDKNIGFLLDVYRKVVALVPNTNLIIAGDGPSMDWLLEETADCPRVFAVGRVPRESLRDFYSLADLFVFPSDMDTFGMVILEAQACGLPVLVTDIGGPKELVVDGETGYIHSLNCAQQWVSRITELVAMKESNVQDYQRMREAIQAKVRGRYSIDSALFDVLGVDAPMARQSTAHIAGETNALEVA